MKYISKKIVLFVIAFILWLIICAAYLIYSFSIDDIPGTPILIFLGINLLFIYIGYRFIWVPYKKIKKVLNRFASGYTIDDVFLMECSISPEVDESLKRLKDYLSTNQVLEANRNQAQYLALQNQINPHFLYNALEGIRSEAISAGNQNITHITEALATFFRYTISNVQNEVTIKDELESVENYFFIQKYRFEDKLNLEVSLPEDDTLINRLYMPKLVLQPIVENVIIHGIEPKTGSGKVFINIEVTEFWVMITVSDDGVGMSEEKLKGIRKNLEVRSFDHVKETKNGGIALVNVNNRIKLIYGEDYGLSIYSTVGVGTDVEILIPVVKNKGEYEIGRQ